MFIEWKLYSFSWLHVIFAIEALHHEDGNYGANYWREGPYLPRHREESRAHLNTHKIVNNPVSHPRGEWTSFFLCKHGPEEHYQGANNNGSLVVMAVNSLQRLMGSGNQSWTTRRSDDCHDQGSAAPWKHVRVFVGVWMDFCVSHQASCTSFGAQV